MELVCVATQLNSVWGWLTLSVITVSSLLEYNTYTCLNLWSSVDNLVLGMKVEHSLNLTVVLLPPPTVSFMQRVQCGRTIKQQVGKTKRLFGTRTWRFLLWWKWKQHRVMMLKLMVLFGSDWLTAAWIVSSKTWLLLLFLQRQQSNISVATRVGVTREGWLAELTRETKTWMSLNFIHVTDVGPGWPTSPAFSIFSTSFWV